MTKAEALSLVNHELWDVVFYLLEGVPLSTEEYEKDGDARRRWPDLHSMMLRVARAAQMQGEAMRSDRVVKG